LIGEPARAVFSSAGCIAGGSARAFARRPSSGTARRTAIARRPPALQIFAVGLAAERAYVPASIGMQNHTRSSMCFLRPMVVALAVVALTQFGGTALAQFKQIKLTEKQIEGFIAAQKDMATVSEQHGENDGDKPDPKFQTDLENIAKKHGFASMAEYDDVAANIDMVMFGINPQTKEYTDPKPGIQKDIDEITADTSISETEKKEILKERNEDLKAAQLIDPSNIELVKKYYEKIDAVRQ
jgi:hypothetical protein